MMLPRLAVPAACALALACTTASAPPRPAPAGACAAAATAIGAVQGRGERSPLLGSTVHIEGVVTADYEGALPSLNGFYLQDPAGDADPATSDAIFVFNGDRDEVRAGERVRVEGVVEEARGQTQLSRTGALLQCGGGTPPTPADIALPLADAAALERYEGMLVRFPQALYVTGNYNLGRFGEVVLSAGGRLRQPTDAARPGDAARAVEQANARNRIILDDAHDAQNPDPIPFARDGAPLSTEHTLRGGDRMTGLTGVLTWTWSGHASSGSAWRVRPTPLAPLPAFEPAQPRPPAPRVAGTLRVASFNVLNYFNTFGDACTAGVAGATVVCRGAADAHDFERQWRRTVAAIDALGADIVGVLEIENDGYGPGSAIAHLAARLNDVAGTERWRFIDADAGTGRRNALGGDAIKVGVLYRTDRVRPVGRTAALDSPGFVTGGDSLPQNRPSLAQAFERTAVGGRLVVSINHLKSKGSPCQAADAGDGQGHCNAVRTAAARELAAWLAADPTGTGEPDVLLLGDLNAYAQEDPVRALRDAGYTDVVERHAGADGYTYQYAAQWGRLDHALASASLAPQVRGAAAWHINADEPAALDYATRFKSAAQQASLYRPDPFRSSDHDPVVVGLELAPGGR